MTQIQREQLEIVSSHLVSLSHYWLMKVFSVLRTCHNCQTREGGHLHNGLTGSLPGTSGPCSWQLGCARRKEEEPQALGRNSPSILVVIPGGGKQGLGSLPKKGGPKPDGTRIRTVKCWVLERTPDSVVLGLGAKANRGLTTLLKDHRSRTNPCSCLWFFDSQKGNIA